MNWRELYIMNFIIEEGHAHGTWIDKERKSQKISGREGLKLTERCS